MITLKLTQDLKYNFKGFVCGQQHNTKYTHQQGVVEMMILLMRHMCRKRRNRKWKQQQHCSILKLRVIQTY